MRRAALIFLVLAIACAAFAYWGMYTAAGRSTFDEMAGIIHMAAAALGAIFAVVSALCAWYAAKRK